MKVLFWFFFSFFVFLLALRWLGPLILRWSLRRLSEKARKHMESQSRDYYHNYRTDDIHYKTVYSQDDIHISAPDFDYKKKKDPNVEDVDYSEE